jgi:hypothetical protein
MGFLGGLNGIDFFRFLGFLIPKKFQKSQKINPI